MNILSPRAHGFIDYLVVIAFFASPRLLGFGGAPATAAWILGGIHLLLTVLTNFPLGLVRVVPFALHGLLEFGVAVILLALPWLMGFADVLDARNFYLGAGASILLVFLLTDYLGKRRASAIRLSA